MEKPDRLWVFVGRLEASPAASTGEEAMELLTRLLDQTEDELTNIPYDPAKWMTDGRQYAPQPDSARDVPGKPRITRYRSFKHNTFIGANGAIKIQALSGKVVIDKPGSDGDKVDDL